MQIYASHYKTGQYHAAWPTGQGATPVGSGAPTAGDTWLVPMRVPVGVQIGITNIAFLPRNTATGTFKLRAGLYTPDSEWAAGTLIQDFGTMTPAGVGDSFVVTTGSPFTELVLGPNANYLWAVQCDTARSGTESVSAWENVGHNFDTTPWGDATTDVDDFSHWDYTTTSTGSMPASIAVPTTDPTAGGTGVQNVPLIYMYVNSLAVT